MRNYTRLVRRRVVSVIDLELAKRNMLEYVRDLKRLEGMGGTISDHSANLRKYKWVSTWIKRWELE